MLSTGYIAVLMLLSTRIRSSGLERLWVVAFVIAGQPVGGAELILADAAAIPFGNAAILVDEVQAVIICR